MENVNCETKSSIETLTDNRKSWALIAENVLQTVWFPTWHHVKQNITNIKIPTEDHEHSQQYS